MYRSKGFTLIEIIGVMAVIAILASMAAPRIFDAIEDSKVTALVQQANSLKATVADYYSDTGVWPRHIPTHNNENLHQLMVNKNRSGNPINGWDGPYMDQELNNPIVSDGYQEVMVSSNAAFACDLDGDGTQDGQFIIYRIDNVIDSIAQKVSQALDKDGSITSGDGSWKTAGRVRRPNGRNQKILLICLARV